MRFWLPHQRKNVRPLPSYRRQQLRDQLKAGATAKGKIMTTKQCDYLIDKGVASGELDSSGDLTFSMRGSREEIVAGILERCAAWNTPMTRFMAERLADSALRDIRRRRWSWIIRIGIPLILVMLILFAIIAAIRAGLNEEAGLPATSASTMVLRSDIV